MKNKKLLAAAVLLGFSPASFAGVTFTQVTTVDGKKTSVSKVSADGANAKMEIVEAADNPFMPPGSYMLFVDGEMLVVNPAARTYARFDSVDARRHGRDGGPDADHGRQVRKDRRRARRSHRGLSDAALPVQIELDHEHAGHADEDRVEHRRGSVDDDGDRYTGHGDRSFGRRRCRAR